MESELYQVIEWEEGYEVKFWVKDADGNPLLCTVRDIGRGPVYKNSLDSRWRKAPKWARKIASYWRKQKRG